MKRKYHPAGLRLVAMDTEIDGDTVKQFHVCRVNLRSGGVTATACGIKNRSGYQFPFHRWIWKSNNAPICESCYQVIGNQILEDGWR